MRIRIITARPGGNMYG